MKRSVPITLSAMALSLSPGAWASCFTLYDERSVAVYQSTEPPVGLSQRIGTEMARHYPRHFLMMADGNNGCASIRPINPATRRMADSPENRVMDSPLFRDARVSASSLGPSTSSYSASWGSSLGPGSERSPATDVHVNAYVRSNGTVVPGYTRAAPGRGR